MKILLYIVITILFIFGNAFLRSRIEKRNFDPFQVRMESPEVSEPAESNSYGEDMEESGPSEPGRPPYRRARIFRGKLAGNPYHRARA